MKLEHPITFTRENYDAFVRGDKTQHRVPVVQQPPSGFNRAFSMPGSTETCWINDELNDSWPSKRTDSNYKWKLCPFGPPGTVLWVQEPFQIVRVEGPLNEAVAHVRFFWSPKPVRKRKLDRKGLLNWLGRQNPYAKASGRCMYRSFAREFAVLKSVRVERVQDISEADAAAEGIVEIQRSIYRHGRMNGYGTEGTSPEDAASTRRLAFESLWESINAKRGYGWKANPWVWVLELERVSR
jgi:hypothetical protein